MNQKSKNLLCPSFLWLGCNFLSLLTTSLFIVALPSYVSAQNQFAPANSFQRSNYAQSNYARSTNKQPDLGNWIPPNTTGSAYQKNGSLTSRFNAPATTQPSVVSFPESVAPFETGIRTATFEAPVADMATAPSITDRIDGAAATLSKWKDIASEKASTMLEGAKQDGGWLHQAKSFVAGSDIKKMVGSLALVLGLYFAFVWVMRKLNFGGNAGIPSEVVEVLGQVPFGARRSLQLVRLGSKVLLLLNSAEGTQPLGEITDPGEVEHLVSLCQGKRKSRSSGRSTAVQQAAAHITGGLSASQVAPQIASQNSFQNAAQNTLQNVLQNESQNALQPKLGNVGSTSLNEVVRILQQAANPGRAVFEA